MDYTTSFIDNKAIIGILRRACNYVDKRLMDHGIRVAYIVSRLLRDRPGIDGAKLRDICLLAALHDIGAYKTEEISRMLQFESGNVWEHSIYGYLFVKYFSPLPELAPAILYHHTSWRELQQQEDLDQECQSLAQLIHMADRLDICMNHEHRAYSEFLQTLKAGRGEIFEAALTDRMLQENFSPFTAEEVEEDPVFRLMQTEVPFTSEEIKGYLQMIIYSIDFRSRHTVTHTITTTSISYEIAKFMQLDKTYVNQIVCGALMHDLGKIGIPTEILEYPGKLSPQAMGIMRTHVEITDRIFDHSIPRNIRLIALRHHEKLDGSGYPYGLKAADLSVGERIVAVADIVSALAGTRSYKSAYRKEQVISVISDMRAKGLIDPQIVDCMISQYDAIMEITKRRSQPIVKIYENIQAEYAALCAQLIAPLL